MKERPILFSAPMVKALLAGTKTQTRRIVKPQPRTEDTWDWVWPLPASRFTRGTTVAWRNDQKPTISMIRSCPYGEIGDHLWIRETWTDANSDDGPVVCYRADLNRRYLNRESWPVNYDLYPGGKFCKWAGDVESETEGGWKPGIHMFRWASRITLRITDVRVERVQQITEADAIAEGAIPWEFDAAQPMTTGELGAASPYRGGYACLWDDINGDEYWKLWKSNPWVWVVSFERIPQPEPR